MNAQSVAISGLSRFHRADQRVNHVAPDLGLIALEVDDNLSVHGRDCLAHPVGAAPAFRPGHDHGGAEGGAPLPYALVIRGNQDLIRQAQIGAPARRPIR